jgi:tungstate transport system ATP-binding protein
MLPLTINNVTFAHGARVLVDSVTARIDAGSRTVILGPNGAGKSVLMRLCHGLLVPTAGSIQWRASNAGRQAMVFQRPVMLRRCALGNVAYALKLAGVGATQRVERAQRALERVGLGHLAHRAARVLSSGEQQRLALARAWALEPQVLFLDEPTANLDPSAAREVETIIGAIHAAGTKIIMTTHNLGQARRLADEILFLHGGRLLERAPVAQFFSRPRCTEAAAFIKGELPWH